MREIRFVLNIFVRWVEYVRILILTCLNLRLRIFSENHQSSMHWITAQIVKNAKSANGRSINDGAKE